MSEEPKRYYWMKFQRDFFQSLRIKRLRKLAGGDTFTIIYLKLQLLSIVDGGHLTFKGIFQTFEEEMAEEIDESVDNVQITISYLLSCGLMVKTENDYFLPYAAENTGSETANAQRIRRCRERKKESLEDKNISNEIEMKQARNVEIEKDKKKYIKKKNQFDNFDQREYDFEAVENLINQGG